MADYITDCGTVFLLDEEDYYWVSKLNWQLDEKGYVRHNGKRLHNYLFSTKPGFVLDHKNRNPLDNRKMNLQYATASQNAINSKIPSTNRSGLKGVRWIERDKVWRATLTIQGKRLHLIESTDFFEVCSARKSAENRYHTLPGV